MEIQLLGAVQVSSDGRRSQAGPPQLRLVLAALAVDADRPVLMETLVDRIWGDRPPRHPRAAIHANVTLIRRLLRQAHAREGRAPVTPMTLAHGGGGYVLHAERARVDLLRFRDLVASARERADAEQADLLRDAMELWRGPALADLTGDWPTRMRDSWELERLDAVVQWARVQLRLGRAEELIGRLRSILDEHSRVEPLVAVQMRALAATGRAAEALQCYTATRAHLVADFGLEPGTELQWLQRAILRGEIPPPAIPAVPSGDGIPLPRPQRRDHRVRHWRPA